MTQVEWTLCSEGLPEKDGDYLTVNRINFSDGDCVITTPYPLHFMVGEEGGWNCGVSCTGEVQNGYRINDVYAWADCIKDMVDDIKRKEIDK